MSPRVLASLLVGAARNWAKSARGLRRLGCKTDYQNGRRDGYLYAARMALGGESARDRNRRRKVLAEAGYRSTVVLPGGVVVEVVR